MQLAVCQMCKDPVWSYICPDCLTKEIFGWLPGKLSSDFRKFSRSLISCFTSFESNMTKLVCIRCHSAREVTLCPFCYIAETIQWLKGKSKNLAGILSMMLPLENDWEISKSSGCIWKDGIKPIAYEEEERDEGICEECGEYSEETRHFEGRWVCGSCSESR